MIISSKKTFKQGKVRLSHKSKKQITFPKLIQSQIQRNKQITKDKITLNKLKISSNISL